MTVSCWMSDAIDRHVDCDGLLPMSTVPDSSTDPQHWASFLQEELLQLAHQRSALGC